MALVRLCARPTLRPAHRERLSELASANVDWERVAERAAFHGMLGMVYHHLAGRVRKQVPAPVLQSMVHTSRRIQEKNLLATQALTRIAGAFHAADVPLLTFKGPSLAHEYYGNVAFRQFGDIDVLVQRGHLGRARAILEANGYRRTHARTDAERRDARLQRWGSRVATLLPLVVTGTVAIAVTNRLMSDLTGEVTINGEPLAYTPADLVPVAGLVLVVFMVVLAMPYLPGGMGGGR